MNRFTELVTEEESEITQEALIAAMDVEMTVEEEKTQTTPKPRKQSKARILKSASKEEDRYLDLIIKMN